MFLTFNIFPKGESLLKLTKSAVSNRMKQKMRYSLFFKLNEMCYLFFAAYFNFKRNDTAFFELSVHQ